MGDRFTLQQFGIIFQVRNPAGNPYVLIGGQAVSSWAERYFDSEPGLKKYLPFTSGDIDLRGNRDDVKYIASQLDLKPLFPDKVNMTALAGAIPLKIDDKPSSIEVVRTVPGITAATADASAIEAKYGGQTIRVLDPVSLLICKANLALTVDQTNRQDGLHVKIMFLCVREFLREFLELIETGVVPAKGWLGAVNKLSELANSTRGRKASEKFEITWLNVLPLVEIQSARNEKIVAFREKQVARGFPISFKSGGS